MPFKRILVPVDFSGRSRVSLRLAIELARTSGAEIVLLHVLPAPRPLTVAVDAYMGRPIPHASAAKRLDAREQLESLLAAFDHRGVTIHQRIEEGDPAATIVRLAAEDRNDLIVMATHGRSGVAELLLGSVVKNLLCCAPCPVLTLREETP